MNLFTPILRLFNKGPLSNPDTGYQVGAVEKVTTSSGTTVRDERALQISTVWACVQIIANSVASLPLNFYNKTDKGREEFKDKHYLTDLLHVRPNAMMKPRDFRLAMTVQMALWNNAYAEIVYSNNRPVALIPLRPGRMAPFITDDGELTYHYSMNSSKESGVKVYAKKSILHLKGFGTDGVVGAERNNYARESYGLTVSSENFAAAQFANGGRPGGVIEVDAFLTKDQRAQVKALYENMSGGALNKNSLWVLEGGFQYKALDFTADQMQMIATRQHQVAEIARYFGVPEVMINSSSGSTSAWPASFEQQMLAFMTFTLQGYIDEWECAIYDSLVPPSEKKRVIVDHDVSQFIKMDSAAKATFLSTLCQNALMTRNEARKVLNLPEKEGGDALTAQVNLSPLDMLGVREPESPPAANEPPEDTEKGATEFYSALRERLSVR